MYVLYSHPGSGGQSFMRAPLQARGPHCRLVTCSLYPDEPQLRTRIVARDSTSKGHTYIRFSHAPGIRRRHRPSRPSSLTDAKAPPVGPR